MSLSSATNRNDYTGNGSTATYAYGFRIFAESNLTVKVRNTSTGVESTLSLTTDYTVTGVGNGSGGNIVLVDNSQAWIDGSSYLATGYTLTIRRVLPLTQNTDIRNQGDFYPEAHEDAFDYSRMVDQQQQDELDRSVKLPDTISSSNFDPTLPIDIETADAVLVVNATGDGFDVGPTTTEIENAETNATAAAASATAAAASASAASTSETNAAASEANAAASLASAFFRDVVYVTNADSPITIAQADNGKLYNIDSGGGAVTVNLPSISGLSLPFNIGFVLETSGNTVTINRNGTDTIAGNTSAALSTTGEGIQLVADTGATPDSWSTLSFGAVADGSITNSKLAASAVQRTNLAAEAIARSAIDSYSDNQTLDSDNDIVLVDAISGDLTITLPTAVGISGKKYQIKRIDDATEQVDTFVDGNVTVGTENINVASHPFTDLQRVQLTTSGTLPTGLSLATNYYVIYVDSDNIMLASSKANAVADTPVDITAASGGGTHTITSQYNRVIIDGDGSELVEGKSNIELGAKDETAEIASDGSNWVVINATFTTFLSDQDGSGVVYSSLISPAGNWGDITSISVPNGVFALTCEVNFYNNGTVSASLCEVGISSTSGNSTTGLSYGDNRQIHYNQGTSGYRYETGINNYKIEVSSATTYYLKSVKNTGLSNLEILGYGIKARKIGF